MNEWNSFNSEQKVFTVSCHLFQYEEMHISILSGRVCLITPTVVVEWQEWIGQVGNQAIAWAEAGDKKSYDCDALQESGQITYLLKHGDA